MNVVIRHANNWGISLVPNADLFAVHRTAIMDITNVVRLITAYLVRNMEQW